jgi:hypothetical protein
MDTHHGKYGGDPALAALAEGWMNNGEQGDHSFMNEGEGMVLFIQPAVEHRGLHWRDAAFLLGDLFECDHEELDDLDTTLINAEAVALQWDEYGFVQGFACNRAEMFAAIGGIAQANADLAAEEGDE